MHLAIVEDLAMDQEQLAAAIQQESVLLKTHPAELSFYDSGEAFLAQYQRGRFDAVFLDILLGGISGIETARQLREKEPYLPIVFTTVEPDFALEGFSVHASDYLLKPVTPQAVSWCLRSLWSDAPVFLTLTQISGPGHSTPVDVPLDEILYGRYWEHCMEVHLRSEVLTCRSSFRDFTAKLPHTGRFAICARELVVNLSQVHRVEKNSLLLKNGEHLSFSSRRYQELQSKFLEWTFAHSRKDA